MPRGRPRTAPRCLRCDRVVKTPRRPSPYCSDLCHDIHAPSVETPTRDLPQYRPVERKPEPGPEPEWRRHLNEALAKRGLAWGSSFPRNMGTEAATWRLRQAEPIYSDGFEYRGAWRTHISAAE